MFIRSTASLIFLLPACTDAESADAAGANGARDAAGAEAAAAGGGGAGRAPDAGTRPDAHLLDGRETRDAAADGATGCTDDPSLAPAGAVCIETVSGRLIDEDGTPMGADVLMSACGPQQCSPGSTDRSGNFSIPVRLHLPPGDYSVLPHARLHHAGFYFRLPPDSPGPAIDMGDLRTIRMDAGGDLLEVDRSGAPAQSVTSGEVTLEVPDGVYVRVDVESNLAGEEGHRFQAVRIDTAIQDEYVAPEVGVVALYAFEPFEAQFETPEGDPVEVRVSFDNTEGLAPNSVVEVLALGTYLYPEWLAPAVFEPVASGHVTADGERIELEPGQGVRYLTWLGVRAAEP